MTSYGSPWLCPHCGQEIVPILDPDEYDWTLVIGEGMLTADCWHCEKPVTVRCRSCYEYEVVDDG